MSRSLQRARWGRWSRTGYTVNTLDRRPRLHAEDRTGDLGNTSFMPWQETCPVRERLKLVQAYGRGEASMAELCRRFGVSRKTGHKWWARRSFTISFSVASGVCRGDRLGRLVRSFKPSRPSSQ